MFVGGRGADRRANHCVTAHSAASADPSAGRSRNRGADATACADGAAGANDRGRGDTHRQRRHSHDRGGRQRGWQRHRFDDDHSG